MFRLGFVRKTAIHPMDVVEVIVASAVFFHGAWLLSPYFKAGSSVSALILSGEETIPRLLGLSQVVFTGVLLYALARKTKRRGVIRRGTAFYVFTLYLFYGTSSLILYGLERVTWITTFAIALISGVVYLRLKWEVSRYASGD